MIGDLGETISTRVMESVGRAVGRAQERRPLPVDLLESDDAFLAVFDAPGTVKSDIQVRYENGTIRVRIDRFRELHEEFDLQFPGRGLSLDGHVDLPPDASVDPTRASATLKENGTLHIEVPKTQQSDPETGPTQENVDTETDEDDATTDDDSDS